MSSSSNNKKKIVLIVIILITTYFSLQNCQKSKTDRRHFAGLTAARTLGNKFQIILVDRKTFFEFTPSFHYALQNNDYIDRITADIQNYANKNKFQFIRGSVIDLNSTSAVISKSATETLTVNFDYCIIATGSNYASQIKSVEEAQTLEERKEQIRNLISKLKSCKKVLVVGGGAVGVEIAGVCKDSFKHVDIHLWNKPTELLPAFPKRARRLAHNSLTKIGVKIEYGKSIATLPEQDLDSKGRIIVDDFFRFENHLNIYCIGDACITRNNEPKMCYNAIIQGQYSAQNIIKTEKNETSLKKLVDHSNIFNVTTGSKNAILCLGENIAFESCIVHYIKMMIEWITSQSFKGSELAYGIGYLQRQLLIFMATIFGLINRKKHVSVEKQTAYQKLQ